MSLPTHDHNSTKDFSSSSEALSSHKHLSEKMTPEDALKHIQRTGSVSMSPELFEKFYLSPQNKVSGDLRKTFANPTPLAVLGLVMALTPFSCDVMGWRGAGGNGAASTGAYYFMGGLLMIIGAIGEWIMGALLLSLSFHLRQAKHHQETHIPLCSSALTEDSGSVLQRHLHHPSVHMVITLQTTAPRTPLLA
jgi:hypothetical protein